MGRTVATLWHASFALVAGALYFFFVLPRGPELTGQTTHTLGTALRIVAGVVIALAALPVVFTLLRTRKPEYGTPLLALRLRTWSVVAHTLAGVLITGTAISEIWLSLDIAGRWLFGIYGAAAAIAVLGIFGFYLSFVAELPPPPPKPLKPKKTKRRKRRKKGTEEEEPEAAAAEEAEATELDETEAVEAETVETETDATVEATAETEATAEDTVAAETSGGGLRNRRPTGKSARRRRPSGGGVTVDD
ncbi:hypothetical protein [Mycobacterium sp.]|uniref:hypothetical protein n=1 Tax=Mycobacterium sp. TaxID=1785 RepID=UPI003D6B2BE4